MNWFVPSPRRCLVMLTGFSAAIAVGALLILILYLAGSPRSFDQLDPVVNFAVAIVALIGWVAIYTALPAILLVLFAEIASKRSWLFYALSGIEVAFVATALSKISSDFLGLFVIFLVAGAVGGTVYWMIAGHCAGEHPDEPSTFVSKES